MKNRTEVRRHRDWRAGRGDTGGKGKEEKERKERQVERKNKTEVESQEGDR